MWKFEDTDGQCYIEGSWEAMLKGHTIFTAVKKASTLPEIYNDMGLLYEWSTDYSEKPSREGRAIKNKDYTETTACKIPSKHFSDDIGVNQNKNTDQINKSDSLTKQIVPDEHHGDYPYTSHEYNDDHKEQSHAHSTIIVSKIEVDERICIKEKDETVARVTPSRKKTLASRKSAPDENVAQSQSRKISR